MKNTSFVTQYVSFLGQNSQYKTVSGNGAASPYKAVSVIQQGSIDAQE